LKQRHVWPACPRGLDVEHLVHSEQTLALEPLLAPEVDTRTHPLSMRIDVEDEAIDLVVRSLR
jgi:hypothetical protein